MKNIYLLTFLLLISLNSKAQNLSLNDLQTICSKNNWEYVNQYLVNKGWEYYSSKKGTSEKYNTITWSLNKSQYNDKAQSWFYLFTYEGFPNKISMSLFSKNSYLKIQNSLASYGYKLINNDIQDNKIVANYGNKTYTISITTKKRKDTDSYSSDSFTAYEFLLIKKNGIYDPDNGDKVSYYNDGVSKEIEYTLKNGKYEGVFKSYFKNGNIEFNGQYLNDKKTGFWQQYNENGDLVYEYNMLNGKLEGLAKVYEDGKISEEKYFSNDVLNGSAKNYIYNNEGVLILTQHKNYNNSKLNGRKELYYIAPNTANRLLSYTTYNNDLKEGAFQEVQGDSLIIGAYKNNKLNGEYKVFLDAKRMLVGGVISTTISQLSKHSKGFYSNGLKTGLWEYYDITGSLIEKGKYQNNLKTGVWESYYYNYINSSTGKPYPFVNELYLKTNYLNGLKHGESVRFSSLSKEEIECKTPNKNADKCFKRHYKKRDIVSNYKLNKLDGLYVSKDSLGQIVFKGNYKKGKEEGVWLESYLVNSTTYGFKQGPYVKGEKNGKWIHYIDKDTVFFESNYKNNLLSGDFIQFNAKGIKTAHKNFKSDKLKTLKVFDVNGANVIKEYVISSETRKEMKVRYTTYFEDNSKYVLDYLILKPETKISHFEFREVFHQLINNESTGYNDGLLLLTFPDGSPSIKGNMYKQSKTGTWLMYYPKQNAKIVLVYNDFSNRYTTETYYTINNNQLFNGDFIYTNTETKGTEERRIRDGLRDGNTVFYNKNGDKLKKVKYKEGVLKN